MITIETIIPREDVTFRDEIYGFLRRRKHAPPHVHRCPRCYGHEACGMDCAIEPDLQLDNGTPCGDYEVCSACARWERERRDPWSMGRRRRTHPGARSAGRPRGAERPMSGVAVHEILMNAVIHRNYESTTPVMINHYADRMEVLSPGGLYGDLTPDQFPRVTAYRNPVVAEAAKVLGFVNRFGRGIPTAQAELARNAAPPAEFELGLNHVLVTIRRPA